MSRSSAATRLSSRRRSGGYPVHVSVKDRLRKVIEEMTDEEAEVTLRDIDARRADPVLRLLDGAPPDDEPTTPEEDAAAAEAYAEVDAGAPTVSLDELRRDLE
jgi:hypothetical protein